MSKLPFEAVLALRYLRPRRTFVSVITLITIVGVMLGVSVLIVVLSVMSGFGQEWRDRILGFNAHLQVFEAGQRPLAEYGGVLEIIARHPDVKGAAPVVLGKVVLRTQPKFGNPLSDAPVLRGIDPDLEAGVSILPASIVAGEFDVSGNGLLIGTEFAQAMRLAVGDRVVIYGPGVLERMVENEELRHAVLPEEFVVRGIFDVGFSQYNSAFVVSSLEMAQELYDLGETAVHGLQVMLNDPERAGRVREELRAELGGAYAMVAWQETHPEIFAALAVEKNLMFFLLSFIMLVAAFCIANSQITFVVQKTREIGILKAIGASQRQILWLFLSQSLVIGVSGVLLGFGFAMLVLAFRNDFLRFMNQALDINLLPSAIYMLYELPAQIMPGEILLICGVAFVTCVLAGVFPAWKASRLQPVEALRYE